MVGMTSPFFHPGCSSIAARVPDRAALSTLPALLLSIAHPVASADSFLTVDQQLRLRSFNIFV